MAESWIFGDRAGVSSRAPHVVVVSFVSQDYV